MATPNPGQQPSPVQIAEFQRQFQAEAARQGLSPQQFAAKLRAQQQAQQQQGPVNKTASGGGAAQAQQHQQHNHDHQHANQSNPNSERQQINSEGPAKPEALAVANWLKGQELKSRTVVLQEKRRDMFKGGHFLVFAYRYVPPQI